MSHVAKRCAGIAVGSGAGYTAASLAMNGDWPSGVEWVVLAAGGILVAVIAALIVLLLAAVGNRRADDPR
ncbi:hypothetical protein APR12_006177 [Nocardia amikacinitolerans]|uniref:hypothetical protein n=1 Tax=Nocardia amikacinitolerans TaxID=756689 RepID=UPI00082B018F|nr:hypothetical protein [Nocardia amikacinitolerans]MCP2320790.1 hypothetical protein [Nocardia amikacinitolerans]